MPHNEGVLAPAAGERSHKRQSTGEYFHNHRLKGAPFGARSWASVKGARDLAADIFSKRFGKNVWITHHALESMMRRNVDIQTLQAVLEEGEIKRCGQSNLWIFKHIPGRCDNLICAAAVEKSAVVVKTVMINWELKERS